MTIYFVLYLLLSMAAIYCFCSARANKDKARKSFCFFVIICLSLLLALRSPSMGVDLQYGYSNGYLGRYTAIANMSWKQVFTVSVLNYEKGYVVFNKVLSLISTDPQFLLAVCGLICVTSVGCLIYRQSKEPFLSVIIYLGLPCFLMNFSGLRQALAIATTLFAIPMIRKKKIVPFVLITVLASLFHSSAIIFLLAYPIYNIKNSKIFTVASVFAIPVLYVLRYPLFSLLSKIFKENAVPDNNSALTLFLVFFAVYIFAIVFGHQEDGKEVGYRNLFWIACCCQAFGGVYSTVIRIGYYFMIYLTLLLPEVISSSTTENKRTTQKKDKLIFYIVILICFSAFGLYSLSKVSWAMTNPYHFFW